jgi:hypothetical protein
MKTINMLKNILPTVRLIAVTLILIVPKTSIATSDVYMWNVPIGDVTGGCFEIWIELIIKAIISSAIGITFVKVGVMGYHYFVTGGGESAITQIKQSFFKTMSGLILLVLSSLFLQILNPDIINTGLSSGCESTTTT